MNPTKYYTETTKAEVKEAVIPNLEKGTPVPVNPTKYYTEKVQTKTSETVQSNIAKVALVSANPPKFFTKEIHAESTEHAKSRVEKAALVPMNSAKFWSEIPLIEKVTTVKVDSQKDLLAVISKKTTVTAVDLVPTNPTKYSEESPATEIAEVVKTKGEKAMVAIVEVNPIKTTVAKVALVPVNPTNYYSKATSNSTSSSKSATLKKAEPVVINRSGIAPNLPKSNPINTANKTFNVPVNQPSYTIHAGIDEEEFKKLFSETPKSHKDKTVKMLNQLFDNDIAGDNAILLIKNNGDCNIIVRIQGKVHYNLAIPARGENFLTLKKGNYELSGNMCDAKYISSKSIAKNMFVTLAKTSGN